MDQHDHQKHTQEERYQVVRKQKRSIFDNNNNNIRNTPAQAIKEPLCRDKLKNKNDLLVNQLIEIHRIHKIHLLLRTSRNKHISTHPHIHHTFPGLATSPSIHHSVPLGLQRAPAITTFPS
jgi:hypothetical protein